MSKTDAFLVCDVMLPLGRFPVTPPSTFLKSALEEMGKMGLGIVCVADADGKLAGILTDGDIRRRLLKVQKPFSSFFSDDVIDHAVKGPATVRDGAPLSEAIDLMETKQVWDLPVIGDNDTLVGLLHLHPVVQILLNAD
ncbi:CBS domain-containing protein [uncultured Devosia sp.]|uniref:CBS domain-containing protein n=1 Tax=uncultured Devosia sp. TaxID=211434 RepID=UPI0035CAEB52